MNDDVRYKIDELNANSDKLDFCLERIYLIMDLSLSNEMLIFLNYTVNKLFLDYLDDIDKPCFSDKCRNDEIYALKDIDDVERRKLLFKLSLSLRALFNVDEVICKSNSFILLNEFIEKYEKLYLDHLLDLSDEIGSLEPIDVCVEPDSVKKSDEKDSDIVNTDVDHSSENNVAVLNAFDLEKSDDGCNKDNNLKNDTKVIVSDFVTNDEEIGYSSNVNCFENVLDENQRVYSNRNHKYLILYLIISIFSFILLFIYLKDKNKNDILKNKIDDLLEGSTLQQKRDYIKELNDEIINSGYSFSDFDTSEIDNKIVELNEQIEKLTISLNSKKNELDRKKSEYQTLYNRYTELSTVLVPNIITFNQYPNYPNGCEAVALYILLRYYNVDVSVDSVMDALPIGNVPYMVDGVMHGGDPNYEFLGDPRSEDGWGIFDKGLAYTANKFKANIINGTGMDFSKVFELVKDGRPVIVWTSINLKSPYIANNWISDRTGETIYWKRYNHAVVVIGYNDDNIIVSDPINGKIRYFDRNLFIDVYNFMGRRALYY